MLEIFEWKEHVEIEIKEQEYIDRLNPFYNIMRKVVRNEGFSTVNAGRGAKCYILTKPNGEEIEIKNLKKFCEENDLSEAGMGAVMRGRIYHNKGWLCRKGDMSKEEFELVRRKKKPSKTKYNPQGLQYEILSPTGEIFICDHLRVFCREHDLNIPSMQSVLEGRCQYYKGWRVRYKGKEFAYTKEPNRGRIDDKGHPVYWFIKDVFTQEIIQVTNLRHFCKIHGLTKESISKRLYKSGEGQKMVFSRYADFNDVPDIPIMPTKVKRVKSGI